MAIWKQSIMKRRCENAGLIMFDGVDLANREDLAPATVDDNFFESDKV